MSIVSPFNTLHSDLKANFADYCGWTLPSNYGDLNAECAALYEHCAAFDLTAFGRISVAGQAADDLLSKLLCGSLDDLQNERWIWSIVSDIKGMPIDIVRIAQLPNSFLILTSPGARHRVIARTKQIMQETNFGDIKIVDQTEKTGMLGIYGPNAVKAFGNISPLGAEQMEPQNIKSLSLFMMSITIIRGGWLGIDGLEIFGGATACKLAAGAIEKYHKREHIVPCGMECLEIAATEASLPLMLTGQELPYHLASGLKSCSKDGRVLVGIRSDGQAHTHKDLKVQYGGLEIGWTDKIVWSQRFNKTLGLALVDSEMSDLSEEVQVTGSSVQLGAEIVPLPFAQEIAAGIYKN